MPTLKTPLAGSYNQRSFSSPSGKDQFFKGAIVTKIVNQAANTATYYTEKRNGLVAVATPAAGSPGTAILLSPSTSHRIAAYGGSNSVIFDNAINCGTVSGVAVHITETIVSGVTYYLITSDDSTGWYLAGDADQNTAYTGTLHSNTTVDSISPSTAGMYAGQIITGANIPGNTRIESVDSTSAITLTAAATGSASGVSLTKTPVAKQIDPDFPSAVQGPFAEMDGFILVCDESGNLWNSDLNSISSWTNTSFIPANIYTDPTRSCLKYKNYVVVLGLASTEFFFNAGNATGSPFSSAPQLAFGVGCSLSTSSISGSAGLVCRVKDGIYWIGNDGQLYTLDGLSYKRLSPEGISLDTGSISGFIYDNQTMINIGSESNATYWYSVEENRFLEPRLANIAHISGESTATFAQAFMVLEGVTGKVYSLDRTNTDFTDDGTAYTMSIQLATDMGTNKRKFPSELRINADMQASGNLAVSYSDDNGANYSTAQNIALTSPRMRLTGTLGSFEGSRLWKFENSDNVPFRANMVEIDYTVAA